MIARGLAALMIAVAAISLTSAADTPAPARPQRSKILAGGRTFVLEEVDIGTQFGCSRGSYVGVVLRDRRGLDAHDI